MMEPPNLRTLRFQVSPLLAREILLLSDLTYRFGSSDTSQEGEVRGGIQDLGLPLPDLRTVSNHQEALETAIFQLAVKGGSHTLLVLQTHPDPLEGWVCLVPQEKLRQVSEVLSQMPLKHK